MSDMTYNRIDADAVRNDAVLKEAETFETNACNAELDAARLVLQAEKDPTLDAVARRAVAEAMVHRGRADQWNEIAGVSQDDIDKLHSFQVEQYEINLETQHAHEAGRRDAHAQLGSRIDPNFDRTIAGFEAGLEIVRQGGYGAATAKIREFLEARTDPDIPAELAESGDTSEHDS